MKTPQLLTVGRDDGLVEELEQALAGLDARLVPLSARDFRDGLELASARLPEIVCADFDGDVQTLVGFAAEVNAVSPHSALVALYRPETLGGNAEARFVIDAMRGGVDDVLRRPISGTDLQGLLERRATARQALDTRPAAGTVITCVGCKGGVGKSTLAVNLACELARRAPDQVLLVDASLQLGVCSMLLDLEPSVSLVDALRERHRLDATMLRQLALPHSSGVRLLPAPPDAIEAAEIDPDGLARLLSGARRAFDYIVVDTFPLLDGNVMAALDLSDEVLVVMQGTVPDVVGSRAFLRVLGRLGIGPDRRRVIVNRTAGMHGGRLSAEAIEDQLDEAIFRELPYDRGILVSQNAGTPHVLRTPLRRAWVRGVRALADEFASDVRSAEVAAL